MFYTESDALLLKMELRQRFITDIPALIEDRMEIAGFMVEVKLRDYW